MASISITAAAPTWLTGSYDPESKTVYWPTGNAGPDFNGDNRKGDNLYTCSDPGAGCDHRQTEVALSGHARTTNGIGTPCSPSC